MSKSLVIVESPAKARTINKYLGTRYLVKSSVGHIRDLPTGGKGGSLDRAREARAQVSAATEKMTPEQKAAYRDQRAKQQLFERMGVDPENGWRAAYEVLPGKEKVVAELQRLARDAEDIYLATDLDREGEAIAWHLREAIGGDAKRYKRVIFNEITKRAVEAAFAKPGQLDMRYVEAQQARRFLDRVVGFMVSPLLWAKIARGLSAGRVQSVAVRLVVEREREIRAFIPEEYWEVFARLRTAAGEELRCEVVKHGDDPFRPGNEEAVKAALTALRAAEFSVGGREDKPTSSKPKAPLITSTLQQAASTRLGFGVKKTMAMAQRLYEAGHITYMRTDSTHLSDDAVANCREFIEGTFGAEYLPKAPIRYSSKEGAQEAHEAIRPSDLTVRAGQLSALGTDAMRLYELIWQFFVACQMPPARYLSSTVTIVAGDYALRAKGRIMKFDGYLKVMPSKDDDVVLPAVEVGEGLGLENLEPVQHFTKPPPRYSEASLVRELEKRAIGRPSTYASIISTIQERGYVKVENRRFFALKMGDIVTERLAASFENLMNYDFTARMEEQLDEVARGGRNWKDLLDNFYAGFSAALERAKAADGGMRRNAPTDTAISCPDCGRPMQIRTAATGVFLGCSGYALAPKERCKRTLNLMPGDEAVSADSAEEAEARENALLREKRRCPRCQAAMEPYLLDEKRKLHICGENPDCPGHEIEEGEFKIRGYDGPVLECDKCGAEMRLKTGRFGKYFDCSGEDCKNTRKLLRNGQPAPPKMDPVSMPELRCEAVDDHFVLRDGAAGMFLAASQYPKNRETRAPRVAEILPHKAEIDPKYTFLFTAPTADDAGNLAVIRYSRKSGEHYVQTEVDRKPTGWKAFYRKNRWETVGSAAKRAASKRPAAKRPAAKQAASKKPAVKRTAAKQAATRQAGAKGTTAKRPPARQSAAERPATGSSHAAGD